VFFRRKKEHDHEWIVGGRLASFIPGIVDRVASSGLSVVVVWHVDPWPHEEERFDGQRVVREGCECGARRTVIYHYDARTPRG